MILKDGTHWEPSDEDMVAWQQNFKDVDFFAELGAMESWCDANPSKRKTRKGIKRFINAWLNRAKESGGSPFAQKSSTESSMIPMKKWTQLDDLTHDFMQSASFRNECLAKFGQYVTYSGERISNGPAMDGAEQVSSGAVLPVRDGESKSGLHLRDSQTYENV